MGNHKKKTPSCLDGVFFLEWTAGRLGLAASTCAKRVKSRGEAGLLRMAVAIRGMPGSEFEPRRPLQKTRPPFGWSCFLECTAGRGSKGHERSEKNVLGARFGARVRVAARQRRERASSRTPRRSPSCQPPPARCRGAAAGTLPRNRLASSAAGGASALSSSPAPS